MRIRLQSRGGIEPERRILVRMAIVMEMERDMHTRKAKGQGKKCKGRRGSKI